MLFHKNKAGLELKQVIIIRTDLKMGKGKIAAQASHASLLAALNAKEHNKIWFDQWMKQGMKKIVLKVSSENELREIFQKGASQKLPRSYINDAGHTQLPPGTATAVGIGPAPENIIDSITGKLQLL